MQYPMFVFVTPLDSCQLYPDRVRQQALTLAGLPSPPSCNTALSQSAEVFAFGRVRFTPGAFVSLLVLNPKP
jgi:hypothetical protein